MVHSIAEKYQGCGLRQAIHRLHSADRAGLGTQTNQNNFFHDILCTISDLDGEFKRLEHFLLTCKCKNIKYPLKIHECKHLHNDIDSLYNFAKVLRSVINNMKTEITSPSEINQRKVYAKRNHSASTVLFLEHKLFELLEMVENIKNNIIRNSHYGSIHQKNGGGEKPLHYGDSPKNNSKSGYSCKSKSFKINGNLQVLAERAQRSACLGMNQRLKLDHLYSPDDRNQINNSRYSLNRAVIQSLLFDANKPELLTRGHNTINNSKDYNYSPHHGVYKIRGRVGHGGNQTNTIHDTNNSYNNIPAENKTRKRAGKDSYRQRPSPYSEDMHITRGRDGYGSQKTRRSSKRQNKQQTTKRSRSRLVPTTSEVSDETLEGARGNSNSNKNSLEDEDGASRYTNSSISHKNSIKIAYHSTGKTSPKYIKIIQTNNDDNTIQYYETSNIKNRKKKSNIFRSTRRQVNYESQECEPEVSQVSDSYRTRRTATPCSTLNNKLHNPFMCNEFRYKDNIQKYFEKIPSNKEEYYVSNKKKYGFNYNYPLKEYGCGDYKRQRFFNKSHNIGHVCPNICENKTHSWCGNDYSPCSCLEERNKSKSLAGCSIENSKKWLPRKYKEEFNVKLQSPSQKNPLPVPWAIRRKHKDTETPYLFLNKKALKYRSQNIQQHKFQFVAVHSETSLNNTSSNTSTEYESEENDRLTYGDIHTVKRRKVGKYESKTQAIASRHNPSYKTEYYRETPYIRQKTYQRRYKRSFVKSRELLYADTQSSSEESSELPEMKTRRTSTSEIIKAMKSTGTNTVKANLADVYARRTSTSELVIPTKAIGTNTFIISTKESGVDPILEYKIKSVEKRNKFTTTDKTKVRSLGTDPTPEKTKPPLTNKATDPLYYLSQKTQHTNTVPLKNKDMQDTGTDPKPFPRIDKSTVGNDPLYYLGQKVKETNTSPFVTANAGTETLPVPKQISKGTGTKRLETKEEHTSYEKVRTSNKANDPFLIKQFDKGLQYDTIEKKPKMISVFTNTDDKKTIFNFTQTSFMEDQPIRTPMFDVKTQTSYESFEQKCTPILRPPLRTKILSNVSNDMIPCKTEIKDPPQNLVSTPDLSVHLFFEKTNEEIYRRRSQIGNSACSIGERNKPLIICEKRRSNIILITNQNDTEKVNADTFSQIGDLGVLNKYNPTPQLNKEKYHKHNLDINHDLNISEKTRLSKDCGMNVRINRPVQDIHVTRYNGYMSTAGDRRMAEVDNEYDITYKTDWKDIAKKIKEGHTVTE